MKKNRSKVRAGRSKPYSNKVDPRLSYLLSLRRERLRALKAEEDGRRRQARDGQSPAEKGEQAAADASTIALSPLTAGLYFPETRSRSPLKSLEPYVSAIVLCDGSAEDLRELGARVRSQAGDVFTVFAPLSAIRKLQRSPAVRFIELAHLNVANLDAAIPFAKIDTLHNATPPVTGAGVVVGILETCLDIYHPDFCTSPVKSRVLYLWDQNLDPQGGEAGPPTHPALPDFNPLGGTYGVEYDRAAIDNQLTSFNAGGPPYTKVRHAKDPIANLQKDRAHGTFVAGCAVGSGRGDATRKGAAPGADIIFVSLLKPDITTPAADSAGMLDGFSYVFARAAQLGKPCVINRSGSDNQGPHDGKTVGERFLDNLLLQPGRAITVASGNSNNVKSHAEGDVTPAGISLELEYKAKSNGDLPRENDAVEIWYDGHDRFDVTLTIPTATATIIGPVAPGAWSTATLPDGTVVRLESVLNDGRNNDNLIYVSIVLATGTTVPLGKWVFKLAGTTVINGRFHAWVDKNNVNCSAWVSAHLKEGTLTLGVPSTAYRPITVGFHDKAAPPLIHINSGRGPTRDGRIKPELAATGLNVNTTNFRDDPRGNPNPLYVPQHGSSISTPLVAGACALLFECRGPLLSCADIKQILLNTAGTDGEIQTATGTVTAPIPNNGFGFGYLQMANACTAPAPSTDVWLKDHPGDTGVEPSSGGIAWLSPDIEVLDRSRNPVPNPTHDPAQRFNNIIRVTVRNRGTQPARNTEVFLYWADPATNLPFPAAWNNMGIFTGTPSFLQQSNTIVVPLLAPGGTAQVEFAWAPPAPGGNLSADDHFCLLARLEHEGDPSQIGAGGWVVITAKNNIALRNVHVQSIARGIPRMKFYVAGSDDDDSLLVTSDLASGRIELNLPLEVLPWRVLKLIKKYGRRVRDEIRENIELRNSLEASLSGPQIKRVTDIDGAKTLRLRHGRVTILLDDRRRLWVPQLNLATGSRLPATIRVTGAALDGKPRYVHVTQLSGGRLIGGVSLELRR